MNKDDDLVSKLFYESFCLRFNKFNGNLKKTHLIKIIRRNIARIKTKIGKINVSKKDTIR
ncbi:MAG: 50S ribosomal protein L29 [Enterobacteriaceae bacterium]